MNEWMKTSLIRLLSFIWARDQTRTIFVLVSRWNQGLPRHWPAVFGILNPDFLFGNDAFKCRGCCAFLHDGSHVAPHEMLLRRRSQCGVLKPTVAKEANRHPWWHTFVSNYDLKHPFSLQCCNASCADISLPPPVKTIFPSVRPFFVLRRPFGVRPRL